MYTIRIGCDKCGHTIVEASPGHLVHNATGNTLEGHFCPFCKARVAMVGVELDILDKLVHAEKIRQAINKIDLVKKIMKFTDNYGQKSKTVNDIIKNLDNGALSDNARWLEDTYAAEAYQRKDES